MTAATRSLLIDTFGFPEAHLPVKYLGIPLASRVLKTTDYSPLIDKFAATVKKWNGKTLSFAGRLELIRACLQGIEAYWLQAFPIVGTVTTRLVAIARQFLWGSKFSKVAWKDVCLPREEGGLGLRDLGSWNTALHAKILWNIFMKKDTLWIQWVHTEIIQGIDFWEWQPRQKIDSPLIKHLISIRDEMEAKIPRQEVEAKLIEWSLNKGTQVAYDWFGPRDERRFWAKFVWKDPIPPKHSFICWLILRERLTTRDRVTWTETDKQCALCTNPDETIEHRRRVSTVKAAIKWIARNKTGSTIVQKARRLGLMATTYFVWKARNALINEGRKFDANRTIFLIKTTTYTLLYSRLPDDQVIQHLPDQSG